MARAVAVLATMLMLAACGEPDRPEGALTADEEQRLNEAAEMLDQQAEEPKAE